jgi:hypothetical protein
MSRKAFYDAIRPAFGGKLSQRQVDGMDALLDEGRDLPLHHMAHVLAHVRRETGGYMAPIKETVMLHHKDKNPSDAEVIRRLDVAFAKGQLKGVKKAYWRDGWFGRGQIQITHKDNYDRFNVGKEEAMHLPVSARIAVQGMARGMFRGKKLGDYDFPAALDNPPATNPRRIVNGEDGSDKEVAASHRQFAAALEAAAWGETTIATPTPTTNPLGPLSRLLVALLGRFRKDKA